jgi:hypothetical protein
MTLANVTISSGTSNLASTSISNGTSNVTIASSGGNITMGTANTLAITIDTAQNFYVNKTAYNDTSGNGFAVFPNSGVPQVSCVGASNSTNKNFTVYSATDSAYKFYVDYAGGGYYAGNLLVATTSNIAANAKIFALGNGAGIAVGYGTGSAAYRHMYMNLNDGTLYFFNPTNYASLSAAGAWTNASDARLKKNIVDIKYGLADVLKAQPRSYQMNAVDGDFVGFIAQELQTIIPEVVSGDPEKQLGVDYGSLVAVAFKAIQELKAINDTQAETINALTARIVALESK